MTSYDIVYLYSDVINNNTVCFYNLYLVYNNIMYFKNFADKVYGVLVSFDKIIIIKIILYFMHDKNIFCRVL